MPVPGVVLHMSKEKNPTAGPSLPIPPRAVGQERGNSTSNPLSLFFRIASDLVSTIGKPWRWCPLLFLSAEMHLMSCVHFPRTRPGQGQV